MANHIRRQLREAVGTVLTGLATTGARVYQSRVLDLERQALPCLLVYVEAETLTVDGLDANVLYQREITLHVHGIAEALVDLDDTLDQIGKEVEVALAPVLSVAGGSALLELQTVDIAFDAEASLPVGRIGHAYRVVMHTTAAAPDVALDR